MELSVLNIKTGARFQTSVHNNSRTPSPHLPHLLHEHWQMDLLPKLLALPTGGISEDPFPEKVKPLEKTFAAAAAAAARSL